MLFSVGTSLLIVHLIWIWSEVEKRFFSKRLFSLRSIASLTANTGKCLIYEAGDSRKRKGAFILKITVRAGMCLKQKNVLELSCL